MASQQQVKQYLAYWFQLGKPLVVQGGKETLLPRPVLSGDRYSHEFETCWQRAQSPQSGDCYLEGTNETIAKLLTPSWDISSCARCAMPVPFKVVGVASLDCVCTDMPTWPNTELPSPRSPVESQSRLSQLRDRLQSPASVKTPHLDR